MLTSAALTVAEGVGDRCRCGRGVRGRLDSARIVGLESARGRRNCKHYNKCEQARTANKRGPG